MRKLLSVYYQMSTRLIREGKRCLKMRVGLSFFTFCGQDIVNHVQLIIPTASMPVFFFFSES